MWLSPDDTKHWVPLEQWERLRAMCSIPTTGADRTPLPVKAKAYRGWQYTAFGIVYGPWSERMPPMIRAYRLVPRSLYDGPVVTAYHDEKAILRGERERGDHTGLLVKVQGAESVCAERVNLAATFPQTAPISLEEAQEHEAQAANAGGWRALRLEGRNAEWFSHTGHPVVRYTDQFGEPITALLYRGSVQAGIAEMHLSPEVELDAAEALAVTPRHSVSVPAQLGLF